MKLCFFLIFFVGNRDFAPDDPLEFKSHQWFGASVRSKNDKILVSFCCFSDASVLLYCSREDTEGS